MNKLINLQKLSVTIDITPLRGEKTGIGNYIHYTLKYLLKNHSDININGISFGLHQFQNDSLEIIRNLSHNLHVPIPVRGLYMWWNIFNSPKIDIFKKDGSILHFTNYYLPPIFNSKTVLTIYDLSFLTNPQWVSPKIIKLFAPTIRTSSQRASHIITCSEKSKKDIEELLEIPSNKISVAYPGIDDSFFYPIDKEESNRYIETHYHIKPPFILFVGTIEERKNISGLLKIYEKINRQVPHKLVLIGKKGFCSNDILLEKDKMEIADKVIYLDYIQEHKELRWFYNSADLFVFPSFDEGFGIPPLEAMACGCPVIVSNQGALPEVVGPKGITIHPKDVESFAIAILQILTNIKMLNEIKKESFLQAKNFNWSKTAQSHYEVYKKLGNL